MTFVEQDAAMQPAIRQQVDVLIRSDDARMQQPAVAGAGYLTMHPMSSHSGPRAVPMLVDADDAFVSSAEEVLRSIANPNEIRHREPSGAADRSPSAAMRHAPRRNTGPASSAIDITADALTSR
jgi:hypothetical protein